VPQELAHEDFGWHSLGSNFTALGYAFVSSASKPAWLIAVRILFAVVLSDLKLSTRIPFVFLNLKDFTPFSTANACSIMSFDFCIVVADVFISILLIVFCANSDVLIVIVKMVNNNFTFFIFEILMLDIYFILNRIPPDIFVPKIGAHTLVALNSEEKGLSADIIGFFCV